MTLQALNEFTAASIAAMDSETLAAWESLSDFERKTIAASAYFYAENVKRINRADDLRRIIKAA